jgi:hypothetical protein
MLLVVDKAMCRHARQALERLEKKKLIERGKGPTNAVLVYRTYGVLSPFKRYMILRYVAELGNRMDLIIMYDTTSLLTASARLTADIRESMQWLSTLASDCGGAVRLFKFNEADVYAEYAPLNRIKPSLELNGDVVNRVVHTPSAVLLKRRVIDSLGRGVDSQGAKVTHMWMVEDDVRFSGDSKTFFFDPSVARLEVDLLDIESEHCMPTGSGEGIYRHVNLFSWQPDQYCKTMEHVRRYSMRLLDAMHDAMHLGLWARSEAFDPTVCNALDWCTRDQLHRGRWRGKLTWNEHVTLEQWRDVPPNRWHHPIKWMRPHPGLDRPTKATTPTCTRLTPGVYPWKQSSK